MRHAQTQHSDFLSPDPDSSTVTVDDDDDQPPPVHIIFCFTFVYPADNMDLALGISRER